MRKIICLVALLSCGFALADQSDADRQLRLEQESALNEIFGGLEAEIPDRDRQLELVGYEIHDYMELITKDIQTKSVKGRFQLALSYKDNALTIMDVQTLNCEVNELACQALSRRILNEKIVTKVALSPESIKKLELINLSIDTTNTF